MEAGKQSPEEILERAVQITDPADRQAFLDEACTGDDALREEVESLLTAYVESGSFLDVPAVDPSVTREAEGPAADIGETIGRYKLLDIGEEFFSQFTCLSPDWGLLAVNCKNGAVKVWNLTTADLIHRFEDQGETDPVAFFDHGKKLVTVNRKRDSHDIWDLTTGKLVQSWPGASELDWWCFPVFGPDEQWSLSISTFGHHNVLKDFTSGRETNPPLDVYEASYAAISADGRLLAVSSNYGFIRIWDAKNYNVIDTLTGFLMGIHAVTFSPYERRLAAGGDGVEAVKIWDTDSWQELLTLSGEDSGHYRVEFSTDGSMLGSLSNEGPLHIWRAPSWEEIEAAEAADNRERQGE